MARQDPELDPSIIGAIAAVAIPIVAWFFLLPSSADAGLRSGFYTRNAVLPLPSVDGGIGPTVITWTILIASIAALGALGFLAFTLLPKDALAGGNKPAKQAARDRDKRRPVIPIQVLLVAMTTGTYALVALIVTLILPQLIAAIAAAAAAAGLYIATVDPLTRLTRRQQLCHELEWQVLGPLGYTELPSTCVVTVTKWTTDELANPDDNPEDEEHLQERTTYREVPERPREFTLRYTGRRGDLSPDVRKQINTAARGRFSLNWDPENQLITAIASAAEPANVMRLRDMISGQRLFKTGAIVKDIAFNPGGEIIGFSVRHRISPELAGNDGATALIERRLSDLLPGRWRARQWDHTRDLAKFELRPELSTLIDPDYSSLPVNHTIEQVCAAYEDCAIGYALNEDKEIITWVPKLMPHSLLTGPTGTGKTGAIQTIIAACAYFGFECFLIDFKGMEFNGFRDYPNVVTLVTEVYEAVAVLAKVYDIMIKRYRRAQRNSKRVRSMAPILVVIDEYTEFQDRLDQFWKLHKPTKGGPRACPTLDNVGSILRLGRTARVHVMAGLQRPDVSFLKGEARDNFTHRISLGKLSSEAAQMIWGNQYVGKTIPLGIRGRGNARDGRGNPVEVQVWYTPDPATEDPKQRELLDTLKPPTVLHKRRVLVPPPHDPSTMAPSEKYDPSNPQEGDFAYYQQLKLVLAEDYPQFDQLSEKYDPPAWLAVEDEDEDEFDDNVVVLPGRNRTPTTPDELIAAQSADGDEYEVAVSELQVGQYILIEPGSDMWGTVVSEPVLDIEAEGMAEFVWRHDKSGAEEIYSRESSELVTVKEIPEWLQGDLDAA